MDIEIIKKRIEELKDEQDAAKKDVFAEILRLRHEEEKARKARKKLEASAARLDIGYIIAIKELEKIVKEQQDDDMGKKLNGDMDGEILHRRTTSELRAWSLANTEQD